MSNLKKIKKICGLDEAGRGALAGPIVVAGVVLPSNFSFKKIFPNGVVKDSKQLSKKQQKDLAGVINEHGIQVIIEIISAKDINKKGINWANIEGFRRIVEKADADQYIVDGRWKLPDLGEKNAITSCVIKADTKILAALSAGVVAKVKRDEIMSKLHRKHPGYGWNTNTGHGTREHIEAIRKYGETKYHKKLFVKTAIKNYESKNKKNS
jgi:ribonuclease HII